MKQKLKMILLIITVVLAVIALGTTIFINLSPQFGASGKAKQTAQVLHSPNYKNGKFKNQEETVMMTGFKLSTFAKFFTNGDKVPDSPVPG